MNFISKLKACYKFTIPLAFFGIFILMATPLLTWSYIISFHLLGVNPLSWHVYSLFWRWISVVCFWLVLNQIWPNRKPETIFSATIFALYPRFTMQPMAVAYFEVWLSYSVLWASIYFSVLSIQKPEKLFYLPCLRSGSKTYSYFYERVHMGGRIIVV